MNKLLRDELFWILCIPAVQLTGEQDNREQELCKLCDTAGLPDEFMRLFTASTGRRYQAHGGSMI